MHVCNLEGMNMHVCNLPNVPLSIFGLQKSATPKNELLLSGLNFIVQTVFGDLNLRHPNN